MKKIGGEILETDIIWAVAIFNVVGWLYLGQKLNNVEQRLKQAIWIGQGD
jgi:hypothetical protein|tara:strand:- start:116 stop:265 length:150 start_codon:yes stop_codon:yes gene_type:complete